MSVPPRRFRFSMIVQAVIAVAVLLCGRTDAADDRFRLLFLGPEAPQILDVSISAGTYSVEETRQKYAEALFQFLDRDKNGSLDADEAGRVPADGRLRSGGTTLGENWKSLDESPADGSLSSKELFVFVDRVSGPRLSAVKEPPKLSQSVRLYDDLDLNHDGRIDGEEVQQGLSVLRSFDFDDDETLSVAELQPFPLSVLQAQRQEQVKEEPMPLFLLGSDEEVTLAADAVLTQLGADGEIPSDRMPGLAKRRFDVFDRDRNGRWNRDELILFLRKSPVDSVLAVSLAPPNVKLTPATEGTGWPVVKLGGVPVECQAQNTAYHLTDSVQLYRSRAIESDRDKNGYLDAMEFTGLQAGDVQFASVDLDGNEQVTSVEIALFFKLDGLARQNRLLISLSDETKTIFDVLDANDDRRLNPREFLTARGRLLAFDRNHDAALVQGEFASEFRITFGQPKLYEDRPDQSMAMGRQPRTPRIIGNDSGPLWFRRMDRNGDGEISWREFLGPREKFDFLDQDHDGFINATETESAEQMRVARP